MVKKQQNNKLYVKSSIYRGGELWVPQGNYDLVKVFDDNRLVVRLSPTSITLVPKVLTDWSE